MILRDDTAHKSQELAAVLHHILGDINQANLVVQFVHMLRILVKIHDIACNLLDFAIHLLQ